MIFDFIQTQQDFYSASFTVVTDHGETIANAGIQGIFRINLQNVQYELRSCQKRELEAVPGYTKVSGTRIFRPRLILENGQMEGSVYHAFRKAGMFKEYGSHRLQLGGECLELFIVGMGEAGLKMPVYNSFSGGIQIAEIDKDCVTKDGKYVFHVFLPYEQYLNHILIMTAYVYLFSYYEPGKKVVHGVEKSVITTKDPVILGKYNPVFWGR